MPIIGSNVESKPSRLADFGSLSPTRENRLKAARNVVSKLNDYGMVRAPERPEDLELGDAELCDAARKRRSGSKLTKVQRESLALFGVWRAAVFRAEDESAGNMLLLLGLLNFLEPQDGDGYERAIAKIREFLRSEFRAEVPGPPAPLATGAWAQAWASRYSEQRTVLSLAMRRLDGRGFARIEASEEEEDDNQSFA